MKKAISIVVADDHPLFRDGVIRSLEERSDMDVVGEAGDADGAVALIAEFSPDIALLDISMPGNGIEAARKIAALDVDTRTIMLTVSENDDDIVDALKAGAVGYVLKGVGADELVSVIKGVNGGSSYVSPTLAARVLLAMKDPESRTQTPDQLLASLTNREFQILELISQGMSNKEAGRELGLQEKTIKHYMTNILQKLQAKNRVEAAVKARDVLKGDRF